MIFKHGKSALSLILTIAIIIVSSFSASGPSLAATFSDVDNHFAKSYIESASSYKAISGYPDSTFKPDNKIKRIEFIAIIVNSCGMNTNSIPSGEYWGQGFIETALKNNLISLNEYGNMNEETFNKNISREEMASIVVNAYVKSGGLIDSLALINASLSLKDLEDVSPNYYENTIAGLALDLIRGYPDSTFLPKQNASRAEATIIAYRLMVKLGIIKDEKLKENILISKDTLMQGDVLRITIYHMDNDSLITLEQDLYGDFKFYNNNGLIQGYIPTNYNTKPGLYKLKFTNTLTGNVTTKDIKVKARDFRVQKLTIDKSIESSTKTEEANEEYRKYFNPAVATSSPVKYYSESFVLPTKGRLTTEFGESRTVNGAKTSYRHSGLDIAAPRNTDVLATNRGKVKLAMPLILTGNTIVIDHGEGLFSVYLHMEKLFVKEGDLVGRGQLIGKVGSTGFSTGPHLHFTMSYHKFNIEPGYLIYDKALTKSNYVELMK